MQNKDLAPIALFVYNRPRHTEQTLESLSKNVLADESMLYIFADGPKVDASAHELKLLEEVKNLLHKKKWCKEVIIKYHETNIGLAENVIQGISTVVNKHGKIIVLEDDLITSPHFLSYCNEGLSIYENEKNIYSINAYQFPLEISESSTFLCPVISSWGWATWSDRWNAFDRAIEFKDIIKSNKHLRNRFNMADYDYVNMMGNSKSWAIRWYYSVFIRNGLNLFPTKTLVVNIGFDGTGTHSTPNFDQTLIEESISIKKELIVNLEYYSKLLNYFSVKEGILSKGKRLFFKFFK